MLHAGLDLSRRRLDVCLVNDAGEVLAQTAAAPDADGLRHLIGRVNAPRVRAVIESMTGARFVHDTLEEHGWDVLVADAQKVRGLAPQRPRRRGQTHGSITTVWVWEATYPRPGPGTNAGSALHVAQQPASRRRGCSAHCRRISSGSP
jgi:hypothetical protein